jgi:hypothetical protein
LKCERRNSGGNIRIFAGNASACGAGLSSRHSTRFWRLGGAEIRVQKQSANETVTISNKGIYAFYVTFICSMADSFSRVWTRFGRGPTGKRIGRSPDSTEYQEHGAGIK